jgi:hypothetical protein
MKRMIVGTLIAGLVAGTAALLLWPHAKVNAQIGPSLNAEGCSCSRPTNLGAGREQLSIYYCACPGMQCMVTATAAGTAAPPNVVQNCRIDSQVLAPLAPR